jgi:hypothetical protein
MEVKKVKVESIKIKIGEDEIELSIEEARELMGELQDLLEKDTSPAPIQWHQLYYSPTIQPFVPPSYPSPYVISTTTESSFNGSF